MSVKYKIHYEQIKFIFFHLSLSIFCPKNSLCLCLFSILEPCEKEGKENEIYRKFVIKQMCGKTTWQTQHSTTLVPNNIS